MFGSKKDPLVDVVKKVMEGNEVRRQVERDLNTELGIFSRQVLPNEYHSRYDRMLSEKTQIALNEELKGNQTKIDANRNNRIDAHDFKLLRGEKNAALEEADSDNGTFTGAVTDTKTGKKVVSDTATRAAPPTAPKYSAADKEALTQKFKDAASEPTKNSPSRFRSNAGDSKDTPTMNKPSTFQSPTGNSRVAPTPAKNVKDTDNGTFTGAVTDTKTGEKAVSDTATKAAPKKPMSDKEALDQKFKDAAAGIDEDNYSDKRKKETGQEQGNDRAAIILSKIHAKKMMEAKKKDNELNELTGKGKLGAMYQKYSRDAREASTQDDTDENNRKATRAAGMISNLAAKKSVDDVMATYAPGKKRSKMPYKGPKYKSMEEEAMDEVFDTEKGEATRKRYIKGAEGELDRNSALMKDVDKGDKRAIARMKSREDGVFNAQRRKKLSEEEALDEVAPEGDKYERMIKHIKAKYSKGGLTDNEKSIAYATAWKAKNKGSK